MRLKERHCHLQYALFEYRKQLGWYLVDVPFHSLTIEARQDIDADVRCLLTKTNLTLRRVWRNKKQVWRFVDTIGV